MIDAATGMVLPTKATALFAEGEAVALDRARELIDIYACAFPERTNATWQQF